MDVEPFVTLQPDQLRVEQIGEHLRHFRLADAGLSFQEERPAEAEGEKDGRRQAAAGEVAFAAKGVEQGIDGGESHRNVEC